RAPSVVQHFGRADRAPLPNEDPGWCIGVNSQVIDDDPFASEPPKDRGPKAVRTDAADVRHPMAQPREPDRDVCLGPGDMALEDRGLGERPRLRRDERNEALAKRQDLRRRRFRHHEGEPPALRARPSLTVSTSCRPRSPTPAAEPSPTSQLPAPIATAPAATKSATVSTRTPPVGMNGM